MNKQTVYRITPPFRCGDDETLVAWQRKAADAAAKQTVPYAVAPSVRLQHPLEKGFILVPGDEVRSEWYRDRAEFDRLVRNGSILEAANLPTGPEAA